MSRCFFDAGQLMKVKFLSAIRRVCRPSPRSRELPQVLLKGQRTEQISTRMRVAISIAFLGIGFFVTFLNLASAQDFHSQVQPAPLTTPNVPSPSNQTMELKPRMKARSGPRLMKDDDLSTGASEYLHKHRLPFAGAAVFRSIPDGALSVTLTGQVRTQFGRQDAESKISRFLNTDVSFNNQLTVNPDLSVDMIKQPLFSIAELPTAFLDCWQGAGSYGHFGKLDPGFQYLGGCPRALEVPGSSEMCIGRTPSGEYEIESQSASAAVPEFHSHTQLISSDGKSRMAFLTNGSFVNYVSNSVSNTLHINFTTRESCELSDDSRLLSCDGSTLFWCDGMPWYKEVGRGKLHRVRSR